MKTNKLITAVLLAAMLLMLAACGQSNTARTPASSGNLVPAATQTPATTAPVFSETPAPTEAQPEYDAALPVNVMVLNGTTGFGMANLIYAAESGEAALNYSFSVETDASNVTAALVNGSADIAALPTNAAAALYNKTSGGVQALALNTLGVLYLVTDGSVEVNGFEDLRGRTVYAPAQNPTFIFQYLCEANGLTVGEDVVIDNGYAQPADLNAAVSGGLVPLAVLPEPMVTVARSSNDALAVALDLTAEWDKVAPAGSLVQGCVVVRTAFAAEHPAEVAKFLEEYGASVDGLLNDVEGTAAHIEATGVFAKAAVAAKAIPNCNVCFITGAEMQDALGEFLEIMYGVAPASVGGAVPGDDFYYIAG